jgi:hypothetical protein
VQDMDAWDARVGDEVSVGSHKLHGASRRGRIVSCSARPTTLTTRLRGRIVRRPSSIRARMPSSTLPVAGGHRLGHDASRVPRRPQRRSHGRRRSLTGRRVCGPAQGTAC